MACTSEIAKRYFDALSAHDLDAAVALWQPGAIDRFVGQQDLVVHLPAQAPGLIGLLRESDRLALVSDCFYTLDPQTGIKGAPRVAHPAFNADTPQARSSIAKLADLEPAAAWAGHADPVTGDVRAQLQRAASALP